MRGLAATMVLGFLAGSGCTTIIYVEQADGGPASGSDAGGRRDGSPAGDALPWPALPDATVVPADAGPPQDATRQSDASCGPGSGVYPCGPFGTSAGDVMANEPFWGQWDDNGDGRVADDAGGTFDLGRLYLLSASGARLLYVNLSAPWCSTCQSEAARLRSLYQELHPRGVEFLTVLWDLDSHADVADWADYFDLAFPVADDSGPHRMEKYWDGSGVPLNMFVDLRTMKILHAAVDWDEASFRARVNSYLSQP
jgi:thiol-disulfide isomerase/thioredoxin